MQRRIERRAAALYEGDSAWQRRGDTLVLSSPRVKLADLAGRDLIDLAKQAVIGGEPKPEGKGERQYPLTIRGVW